VRRCPPALPRPAPRGLASRRRPVRALLLVAALGGTLTNAGCATHRDESVAGLVVVSAGSLGVTNPEGQPEPIAGPPGDVRRVTASGGRIVAETAGHEFLVSDIPLSGKDRAWRRLAIDAVAGATPSGMDLSPDGTLLAIVFGDPDTPRLELDTADVETGATTVRSIELASNGPPSWLGPDLLALEVIRQDQHSGIATVHPASGEVTTTEAQGIAPSATRDGSRIAVAETPSGLVTTDPATWLAGGPGDAPGITAPAESTVQDVALDADGTRLAVVYTANSGASSSVVILRLEETVWTSVATIPIPGDEPVSVDWLD
jgi:hypothetical protein